MDRRSFLLATLSSLAAGPAVARAPVSSARPTLRPDGFAARAIPGADSLVAQAGLSGKTAFAVSDPRTGRILEAGSPLLEMPPASVAKSVTALYALDTLGAGHRFATRLAITGNLRNGRLDGDLILIGGGDPTLDTDGIAQLAAQAKAAGLREIAGRFLIWEGALPSLTEIDNSQPEHVGYNPAISGLNLNFNRVHFEWKATGNQYAVTMQARTDRYRPGVSIARMSVADRNLPVYTYQDRQGRDDWTVARSALGRGGSRWLPVRRPAGYAAEVMQVLLRSNGIVVPAPVRLATLPQATTIAQVDSAPVQEICRDMLKFSTNLTAECLGLAASGANSLTGSGAAMSRWAKTRFATRHTSLRDHSGLGDASRMSAGDMVKILSDPEANARLAPLLKPFPLRETRRRGLSDAPLTVSAKTGTLNFVSGLAGYCTGPGGATTAFAVFCADMPRRRAIPKADRERPQGARSWSAASRVLQSDLLRRWGGLYGG